ncbi:LOW QUALITY PROTEIN: exonuclease mut-7 homolog [Glossophaga mutica]
MAASAPVRPQRKSFLLGGSSAGGGVVSLEGSGGMTGGSRTAEQGRLDPESSERLRKAPKSSERSRFPASCPEPAGLLRPGCSRESCPGQLLTLLPGLGQGSGRVPRAQLKAEAWRGFAALDDPRAGPLDLLEGSRARRGKGPALEAWVTRELERWLQARPPPEPAQVSPTLSPAACGLNPQPPESHACPSPVSPTLRASPAQVQALGRRTPLPAETRSQDFQGRPELRQLQGALRVLAESPPGLVEPRVSTFQLRDVGRDALLAPTHRLHQEGKFKEAVMLGTKLRLQPELDAEKASLGHQDWCRWLVCTLPSTERPSALHHGGRLAPGAQGPRGPESDRLCTRRSRHQQGEWAALWEPGRRVGCRLQPEGVLPTLLRDKANLVGRHADGFPDLQRGLLLSDSWCQPGFDSRVVARRAQWNPVSEGPASVGPEPRGWDRQDLGERSRRRGPFLREVSRSACRQRPFWQSQREGTRACVRGARVPGSCKRQRAGERHLRLGAQEGRGSRVTRTHRGRARHAAATARRPEKPSPRVLVRRVLRLLQRCGLDPGEGSSAPRPERSEGPGPGPPRTHRPRCPLPVSCRLPLSRRWVLLPSSEVTGTCAFRSPPRWHRGDGVLRAQLVYEIAAEAGAVLERSRPLSVDRASRLPPELGLLPPQDSSGRSRPGARQQGCGSVSAGGYAGKLVSSSLSAPCEPGLVRLRLRQCPPVGTVPSAGSQWQGRLSDGCRVSRRRPGPSSAPTRPLVDAGESPMAVVLREPAEAEATCGGGGAAGGGGGPGAEPALPFRAVSRRGHPAAPVLRRAACAGVWAPVGGLTLGRRQSGPREAVCRLPGLPLEKPGVPGRGSTSPESWVDHVRGLVGPSEWRQEQLLPLLASHGDSATVARCARDLALPEEQLPATVATELGRLGLQDRRAAKGCWGEVGRTPGTPGATAVLLAGQPRRLRRTRRTVTTSCPPPGRTPTPGLVGRPVQARGGAPAAWPGGRPGPGAEALLWRRPRASLMQVAMEGHVFLLDLPALSQPPEGRTSQAFFRLVSQLLPDPPVTKLGDQEPRLQGPQAGVTACASDRHGARGLPQSPKCGSEDVASGRPPPRAGLTLRALSWRIRVTSVPALGVDGAGRPRGLSRLVQQVLGKTQQLSSWDRRPPGEGQLLYAAADARCLLEVYQALCGEPAGFHLSRDLAKGPRPGHSQRPGAWELPHPQEASAPPEQVTRAPRGPRGPFLAVCDSLRQGLARRLRRLGADVLVLGGEGPREVAEVARQEGRVILTSGLPYHKLWLQVGAGRCLWADCSLEAQQAQAVLRHFQARVTHADIFSRCRACNCDPYLKVSKDKMQQLVWLRGHQKGPRSTGDEAQIEDTQEPEPGSLLLREKPATAAQDKAPGPAVLTPPSSHLLSSLWGRLRLRPVAGPTEGPRAPGPAMGGRGAGGWGPLGEAPASGRPGPRLRSAPAHLLLLTPQECTPPALTSLSCPRCLERKPAQIWPRSPGGSLRVLEAGGLCRAAASALAHLQVQV